MSSADLSLLRLRVIADADPAAVARVIVRFQNQNMLLRRIVAEFSVEGTIHIEVDVCGLPELQLTFIAAKVSQMTSIVNAYWHRI